MCSLTTFFLFFCVFVFFAPYNPTNNHKTDGCTTLGVSPANFFLCEHSGASVARLHAATCVLKKLVDFSLSCC